MAQPAQHQHLPIMQAQTHLVYALVLLYPAVILGLMAVSNEYRGFLEVFWDSMRGHNTAATTYALQFSKSLLFVSGLVCSFCYFLVFSIYLSQFIAYIWNPYFIEPEDHYKFIFLIVIQLMDYVLVIYAPHFWYLSVAAMYAIYAFALGKIYMRSRRRLRDAGCKINIENVAPLVAEARDRFGADGDHYLTQYFLSRFCFLRFLYFGLFFGSPFMAVMAFSQFERRRLGDIDLEYFQAGAYVTAAVLFTLLFCFYFILRLKVMSRTSERIKMMDYDYFLRTVR